MNSAARRSKGKSDRILTFLRNNKYASIHDLVILTVQTRCKVYSDIANLRIRADRDYIA